MLSGSTSSKVVLKMSVKLTPGWSDPHENPSRNWVGSPVVKVTKATIKKSCKNLLWFMPKTFKKENIFCGQLFFLSKVLQKQ